MNFTNEPAIRKALQKVSPNLFLAKNKVAIRCFIIGLVTVPGVRLDRQSRIMSNTPLYFAFVSTPTSQKQMLGFFSAKVGRYFSFLSVMVKCINFC